jgi:hypothetical protein
MLLGPILHVAFTAATKGRYYTPVQADEASAQPQGALS